MRERKSSSLLPLRYASVTGPMRTVAIGVPFALWKVTLNMA